MGRSPSAARASVAPPLTVALLLLAGCASGSSGPPDESLSASVAGASSPAGPSGSEPGGSTAPSSTGEGSSAAVSPSGDSGPFRLVSSDIGQNQAIPAQFTCRGADQSPALTWSGTPAGTKALVLLVVDPDANQFVHWTVLDLKPTTTGLPRGVAPTAIAIQQGRNDFGNVGYGGPCPPSGSHHYRFTLSALAAPLKLGRHPSGSAVRTALGAAKVLGRATLIGTAKA